MKTNKHELLYKEETYSVVGCAMDVLNSIGYGYLEKTYEEALQIEFAFKNIPFSRQYSYDVLHREQLVGSFIPDFVVFDSIIVELKSIDKITNREIGQVTNYLRASQLQLGIILNFKNASLEWKRVIL